MKIDLNSVGASQTTVERNAKQAATGNAASGASVAADRTTFSSASTSVQSLVKQALNAPEVRQDKVNTLRQSINNGSYQLDSQKIASAIISEGGQA